MWRLRPVFRRKDEFDVVRVNVSTSVAVCQRLRYADRQTVIAAQCSRRDGFSVHILVVENGAATIAAVIALDDPLQIV
jgi:hypothetical protein